MTKPKSRSVILLAMAVLIGLAGVVVAQRSMRRGGFGGGFGDDQLPEDRHGIPKWDVDPHFKSDVFTFVRIRYSSPNRPRSWWTDFPDSDLNFPFRLQQMTSIKADPTPIILDLSDEKILDYPFIYMLEVGQIEFTDEEVTNLRRYLLNGGFLMVDDHWGVADYERFRHEILRVFPGHQPQELPITHPIFHCVFDLKEAPQVPGIEWARRSRETGRMSTSEREVGPAHYRAVYDDNGRMMVIICSNTDLGDGWEREGEEEWYFHEFSEKKAYPMGINIVFYAMTH